MTDLELRMWCIDSALNVSKEGSHWTEILDLAVKIYDWVMSAQKA